MNGNPVEDYERINLLDSIYLNEDEYLIEREYEDWVNKQIEAKKATIVFVNHNNIHNLAE